MTDMGDDVRKKVWNNTTKIFRMPNRQIVPPMGFNNLSGWDIWKDHDVVKAWLSTKALTEDVPLDPPTGDVVRTSGSLPSAPSVFTGRVEPVRKPAGKPATPQKKKARPSPGQEAPSASQ